MSTSPLEPERSRILTAAAIDAVLVVGMHAGALLFVTGWLLARTDAGRLDAREEDAVIAVAVAGAAAPAWLAWTLLATHRRLGTPGQRVAHIRPVPDWGVPQWALYVRAMVSPLSLPVWLWMGTTPLLAGMPPWLALPAFLVGLTVGAGAAASLVTVLVSPHTRMLHDRVARTSLVTVDP